MNENWIFSFLRVAIFSVLGIGLSSLVVFQFPILWKNPFRRVFTLLVLWMFLAGWQIAYFIFPEKLTTWSFNTWITSGAWIFSGVLSFLVWTLPWQGIRVVFKKRLQNILPERRAFLVQGGLTASSLVFTGVGGVSARTGLRIQPMKLAFEGLPASFQEFRMAHLTDLHVGLTIRQSYVEEVVQKTWELRPDLVVLTGDLVDGDPETLKEDLLPLKQLTKAPLGAWVVLGNHEYYWGAERWVKAYEALGLRCLLNESQVLSWQGASISLTGLTDTKAGRFIPAHTPHLPVPLPEASLRLLLAHRPDAASFLKEGNFHLLLCGHTHAGQFIPFHWFISLFHRYSKGLYAFEKNGSAPWIYVNPGTGYWAAPNRLGVPPEVTHFYIQNASFATTHA